MKNFKKKYSTPMAEVLVISIKDILTASGGLTVAEQENDNNLGLTFDW